MARIRTVKPELAKHELLFALEQELKAPVRFAWVMLFGHADREGRFKWRPNALKTDILPYDEIDFSRVLDAWVTRGLLVRYRVRNEWYGCIPTFRKHQAINPRESASELPSPDKADEVIDFTDQEPTHASVTRQSRVDDASVTRQVHARGEGKEIWEGKECASVDIRDRNGSHGEGKDGNGCDWVVEFERVKAAYPERAGRTDWGRAQHFCHVLIEKHNETWESLEAAAQRYAQYTRATEAERTQHVLMPGNFFNPTDLDKPWSQLWNLPATKGQLKQDANIDAARTWLAESGDT